MLQGLEGNNIENSTIKSPVTGIRSGLLYHGYPEDPCSYVPYNHILLLELRSFLHTFSMVIGS